MIVVAGSFDGFHLGHQKLFEEAASLSLQTSESWSVLTFYPHPRFLLSGNDKRLLFNDSERKKISKYLQVPKIIELPFNIQVANMEPEEFISYLSDKYTITGIVVGSNFRFGKNRVGNLEYLHFIAREKGWYLKIVEMFEKKGTPISSSMIRGLISCGSISQARNLLGYPYFINGKVISGDKRGRTVGFPTANLDKQDFKVMPPDGVYACAAIFNGNIYPAAVNIGFNPTFLNVSSIRIECHILDFSGDLYDQYLTIAFLEKIRGEITFSNASELSIQIRKDTEDTRSIFFTHISNFYSKEELEHLVNSLG